VAKEKKREEKKAIDLVNECKKQGQIEDLIQQWKYLAELLRGNAAVYKDKISKQVISLQKGVLIPDLGKRLAADPICPSDPHMVTISNGIMARALMNPLRLVVRAVSSDDEDKDAAKASTCLLRYYDDIHNPENRLRKKITQWLRPCGNAILSVYWDKDALDYVGYEESGEPMKDDEGNPLRDGDIVINIIPPQSMLVPRGTGDVEVNELPWIGRKFALHIDEIKEKWGVEIAPEENLEDLSVLGAVTADGSTTAGNGKLEDHALVYELYFKPNTDRPHGRHIITCQDHVLEDNEYNKPLTEKYHDEWHPFIWVRYIENAGDFFAKSLFDYLADLQIQLNKLLRQIVDGKKNTRGYMLAQKDTVNWKNVSITGQGPDIPLLEYKAGTMNPPTYVPPPNINQDLVAQYQNIIQRMNDISAYYEVTRGGAESSVKSGKHVELLQQANITHANPLLLALAVAFVEMGTKIIRLCAVHYVKERTIRILGRNNEAISETISPEQLRSDDVTVENLPAFLMSPEARQQQIEKWFQEGILGDPRDPLVRKKYAELFEFGDTDEFFRYITEDIDMARWENQQFQKLQLNEDDPYILQQIEQEYQAQVIAWQAEVETYPERHENWKVMKELFDKSIEEYRVENLVQGEGGALPPEAVIPPDPGPAPEPPSTEPPPPPVPYRRAREEENHDVHRLEHMSFMKSVNFQRMCKQTPALRECLLFHIKDHLVKKAKMLMEEQLILGGAGMQPMSSQQIEPRPSLQGGGLNLGEQA